MKYVWWHRVVKTINSERRKKREVTSGQTKKLGFKIRKINIKIWSIDLIAQSSKKYHFWQLEITDFFWMYFTSHSNKRFDIEIGTGTIWHLIYAHIILWGTCTASNMSCNNTHCQSTEMNDNSINSSRWMQTVDWQPKINIQFVLIVVVTGIVRYIH